MNMSDVKAIQIPDATYELLEYIHFNGNDYIETGFSPWNNFGFYIDIQWDSDQKNQYNGHGKITSENRCFIGVDYSGKITYGSGVASNSVSASDPYTRHTYQVNTSASSAGKFYIDGTQVWTGNSNYVEQNRLQMFIGAVNRGTSDYSYCKAKIYNVRFINNVSTSSVITINWLPAKRKADDVVGFLKIRSNGNVEFVTSANGLLEAGPVASPYMASVKKIEDANGNVIWGSPTVFPYRRLQYIESDGTAALDTQANCARNSFMRLTLEDMSDGGSVQGNGRDNPGSTEARFFAGFDGGNYWFGLGYSTRQGGAATSGPHTLELYGPECQGGSKYKVDGVSTAWYPTFPSSATWYSLFLFANRSNTTTGFNCQSKVRVYRAEYGYQYQSGGTWAEGFNRKLIPVQRKSDGKLGFYDLQDNTFMYQLVSGSGANALSAGPVADEYWDLTDPA